MSLLRLAQGVRIFVFDQACGHEFHARTHARMHTQGTFWNMLRTLRILKNGHIDMTITTKKNRGTCLDMVRTLSIFKTGSSK